MKNRNIKHSDNWATPKWLYDELNKEFNFDFDPCPLNHNMIWDGLNVDWGSCNFVNPPYSRKLKEAFIKKAYYEWCYFGRTSVLLLPVSTSTIVFHEYIYPFAEIRLLKKRIAFEGYNSKGEFVSDKKPMHDSMIIIFR